MEDRAFQDSGPFERGFQPRATRPVSPALALVGFAGLCALVGVSNAAITATSKHTWFLTLARPPGTPPDGVFGPVWGMLYLLLAISAWLVWQRARSAPALRLWGWQLLANALWPPAFFGLQSTSLGLPVMAALIVGAALTARAFLALRPIAAALLLPYLLWLFFAAYLNAGFWWLNAV